ncbi:MAG: Aminopeptidase P domain protein [candidate division TM6 bacterium GW2011_GWF2_28_16]|nr:MAG: Aminopeptidase P domain protein [candidate division TM6 bacterium GW2011_GWF2_28_16]
MQINLDIDYSLFKSRREQVIDFLKEKNKNIENGLVILFSDFESERYLFRPESSFYYLTGVSEPGAVLLLYFDGRQYLYLPNYGGIREKWVTSEININNNVEEISQKMGFTEIKYLGSSINSFSFNSLFSQEKYFNLLLDIDIFLKNFEKKEIYTLLDLENNNKYFTQINIYKNILELYPEMANITGDIAPLVHFLRRFKSEVEIDLIYKAIQITNIAHDAAAKVIAPGRIEREVQAIIESVFIQTGAVRPAFPSIVATGKNTTILHYTKKDQELMPGDLVVVDIGAEYGMYAADLTRTYPVSGQFTERQKEIYNIVLETQVYVESIAKPGMYLNNKNFPEKSLNYLAHKFLESYGLGQYFAHNIGHFLGLDVHDVGDNNYELQPGDVFTIEPGIYIPEENLGIRIEDDFLMVEDGVVCLSFGLPKSCDEIEKLMKE